MIEAWFKAKDNTKPNADEIWARHEQLHGEYNFLGH
jgi:hypothetical protein